MMITVVIPAYNSGQHIGRAIDSVLAQSRPADEIIVIDDGSTDDTAEVVKTYGPKVNYIYQDNAGASAARNTGIKAAKYEWIAFLDADDEWLPEKLKLQAEHIERNPELVWTTANYYRCLCDEDRRSPDIEPARAEILLEGKDYFDEYFRTLPSRCCGWTGTMLIKKEVLMQAGMFQPGLPMANDLDMWFRIAYQWPRIGFIAAPLAVYHMIISQSISQKHKQLEIRSNFIKRHLALAAERDRLDALGPCAGFMVSRWIRGLLFDNRPGDINGLMEDFGELLTLRFKTMVRLLLVFPRATAKICHLISKIVRALHLRSRVIRRPD